MHDDLKLNCNFLLLIRNVLGAHLSEHHRVQAASLPSRTLECIASIQDLCLLEVVIPGMSHRRQPAARAIPSQMACSVSNHDHIQFRQLWRPPAM